MLKETTVTARINPELKKNAEIVLKQLSVSHSEVINMLYSLIVLRKGLPFDVKLSEGNITYPTPDPNLVGGGQVSEALAIYSVGKETLLKSGDPKPFKPFKAVRLSGQGPSASEMVLEGRL